CGRDNSPEVAYCQGCGNPMVSGQVPPPPVYGGYAAPQPGYGPTNYAGIGARFLALLIDGAIIGIPIGIVSFVLSTMMAVRVIHRTSRDTSFNPGMAADTIGTFIAGFGIIMIISALLSWAYFAMMESSGWQGTVGKKIMGIKVTDLYGSRITLGRATIRLVVKSFLSSWLMIGYIMAFFTQRKQSLHDMIAGTLVLSGQPYSPMGYAQPQQYPQQPVYPQQPPAYVPPQQFSTCPYCGGALQPNARFCSNCGHNL
ncbi:MAG TPA: RDD family protein, partial [Negativicutes bacterium]|nr:RDD family protein [Negativicutes bacterium]